MLDPDGHESEERLASFARSAQFRHTRVRLFLHGDVSARGLTLGQTQGPVRLGMLELDSDWGEERLASLERQDVVHDDSGHRLARLARGAAQMRCEDDVRQRQ